MIGETGGQKSVLYASLVGAKENARPDSPQQTFKGQLISVMSRLLSQFMSHNFYFLFIFTM